MEVAMLETLADEIDALQEMGPSAFERFAGSLDPTWLEAALTATGTASIRRRKLPADQAIWLVLGMGLFADRSIVEVVNHLNLVAPGVESLAPSSVPRARYRIGSEPLAHLFRQVSAAWAGPAPERGYRGLSLYAVDGTCVRVQDTDANFEEFGKPGGRAGPSDAGYPQLRMACLMNLGTRLLVDARFDSYSTGEQTLAAGLWAAVPPRSVTILDRGFVNYPMFHALVSRGEERHLLVRMRDNMKVEDQEALSDGSLLARLRPARITARNHPGTKSTSILGRVITYQHEGGRPNRLFTTLLDPQLYPSKELIRLYHDRWEIELGFDELKTHMLERKECLRSKKPDGVRQELWGLLVIYNLIRFEMLGAADAHQLSPKRVSFRSAVLWFRTFWQVTAWGPSPGNLPKHLKNLRTTLDVIFLPPRRTKRRYPRHVKIKMSNYARNRGKRQPPQPVAEA
jgi:hypothetical protein